MDEDEEPPFSLKRVAGNAAILIMDAFDNAEVEEAWMEYATSLFRVARALERADLTRAQIAGMLGGSALEILTYLADEGD